MFGKEFKNECEYRSRAERRIILLFYSHQYAKDKHCDVCRIKTALVATFPLCVMVRYITTLHTVSNQWILRAKLSQDWASGRDSIVVSRKRGRESSGGLA